MADRPHLFFDQTETQRGPKKFFWRPAPFISGSGWPPSPRLIWRSGSASVNLQQHNDHKSHTNLEEWFILQWVIITSSKNFLFSGPHSPTWGTMLTLYRINSSDAGRKATRNNNNVTFLEHVVHTHRTSRRSGMAKTVWWTKSQSSLLNIYFRLRWFQPLLLRTHFRYSPNISSHCTIKHGTESSDMWRSTFDATQLH